MREAMSKYNELQIRNLVREDAAEEFAGIREIEEIRPRTPEFLQ